jgi:hypothetical protein
MIFNVNLVKDKTKKNRERILQKLIKKYQREIAGYIKSEMKKGETWVTISGDSNFEGVAFDALKHVLNKLYNAGYTIKGWINGTYYEGLNIFTLKTEDREYTVDIEISWSEEEN